MRWCFLLLVCYACISHVFYTYIQHSYINQVIYYNKYRIFANAKFILCDSSFNVLTCYYLTSGSSIYFSKAFSCIHIQLYTLVYNVAPQNDWNWNECARPINQSCWNWCYIYSFRFLFIRDVNQLDLPGNCSINNAPRYGKFLNFRNCGR